MGLNERFLENEQNISALKIHRYIGAASDLYVDFPARLWDCQDHGCEDGCI
mgnify:CR=1 FL=1